MSTQVQIVKLDSVILSKEKQEALKKEFQKYADATNFAIKTILTKHITSATKAIEIIQDQFYEKFDPRPQYLRDVVKTARVRIGEHRKLARVLRSAQTRKPKFKEGRIILAPPLIKVDEKALIYEISRREFLPIPYDKRSRNREREILSALAAGKVQHERVRLTWRKEGFVEIDIRVPVGDE